MTSRKLFTVLAALCVLNAVLVSASPTSISEADDVQEVKPTQTHSKHLAKAGNVLLGTSLGAAGLAGAGMLTYTQATRYNGEPESYDQPVRKDWATRFGIVAFSVGSVLASGLLLSGLIIKGLGLHAKKVEQKSAAELEKKLDILYSVTDKMSPETN
eukprot:GHVT01066862.1.p1 GENE.GHVT01066862.1~~GHVT01066862.1.p1  ORF type:complete len:157 (-),score=8.63 GHVT01066862.1:600-1070(-)